MVVKTKAALRTDFIQGGGTEAPELDKWRHIQLHLPEKMLTKIDEKRKSRLGFSRNTWLLQAINEVLEESNDRRVAPRYGKFT